MKSKSASTTAVLGLTLKQRLLLARDWASIRKSPEVDAYILAWIASQVHFHSPQSQYCSVPINVATRLDCII